MVAIIIFVSDRLPVGLVAFMVPMALYFAEGVIDAKDIIFCFNHEMRMLFLSSPCVYSVRHFLKTGLAWQSSKILLKYAKTERSLSVLIFSYWWSYVCLCFLIAEQLLC